MIEIIGPMGNTANLTRVVASIGACAKAYEEPGKNNRLQISAIEIVCLNRKRRNWLEITVAARVLKRVSKICRFLRTRSLLRVNARLKSWRAGAQGKPAK